MNYKKTSITSIFCFITLMFLLGCAKKPYIEKQYNEKSGPQPAPHSFVRESKAKHELAEQDVSGWLDNPEALYVMDNGSIADQNAGFKPASGENRREVKTANQNPENRMIHYDGMIKHRSTDPQKSLDSIEVIIKKYEAYVESRSNHQMIIRVPVNKFQTTFDSILAIGNIIDKSISARDITDSYQDNELRIKIAESTIARLQEILKKTEKDEDKLKLLKEIQRISENLEQLESIRQSLKLMAEYSTISIRVYKYHPEFGVQTKTDFDGFQWINSLDPFKDSYQRQNKYIGFKTPKEMVKLKTGNPILHWIFRIKRQWKSSSADGVTFVSRRIKNKPKGTSDFWRKAINQRISTQFNTAMEFEKGKFLLTSFTAHGIDPYSYIVGVHSHGKYLDIVEIYFPTQKKLERYKQAVFASIEEGVQ